MSTKAKPGASKDDPKDKSKDESEDKSKAKKPDESGDEGDEGDEDSEDEGSDEDSEDEEDPKLDEKTKAYISKLRKENATRRLKEKDLKSKLTLSEGQKKAMLKAAGIASEEEDPAAQLEQSQAETNNLLLRSAILESAVEHGIGKGDLKYYQFLVTEAIGELEDGDEISDDKMAEIVAEVKKGRKAGAGNTSVGDKGKKPTPGESGEITLDKFCQMSITQKSELYLKNPTQYASLVHEARAKKKLV